MAFLIAQNNDVCKNPIGITEFRTIIITSVNFATCIDGGIFDNSDMKALPGVLRSKLLLIDSNESLEHLINNS